MNAKLKTRLQVLEQTHLARHGTIIEQIGRAALATLNPEDLRILGGFYDRGGVVGVYTPEENAALARYSAAADAIAIARMGHMCDNLAK